MSWNFEVIGGRYEGKAGGLAWDGKAMLYALVDESRIMRYEPESKATDEFRRYTYRVNGIAFGPKGELYGGQESGRRIIQFLPDGSAVPANSMIGGHMHNQPSDLIVDRRRRVWFTDAYNDFPTPGAQSFPYLPHASVLRMERDGRRHWHLARVTFDTAQPRALLLSADESTLYVADGEPGRTALRELRAYSIQADGTVSSPIVLHTFGSDHRGPHRGIEGMCLDSEGNIVACAGWKRSGPGPLVYVFSPSGAVLETHAVPGDLPMRCAFGDADLGSLYVTTGDGMVYRARTGNRRGAKAG